MIWRLVVCESRCVTFSSLDRYERWRYGTAFDQEEYRKAEDIAEVLAATELPDDPALKYLQCLLGGEGCMETFKVNEYMPLIETIEHHADGDVEEETDTTRNT